MNDTRKEITAAEFIEMWKNSDPTKTPYLFSEMNRKLGLTFSDYKVIGEVNLPEFEQEYQQIKLINCELQIIKIEGKIVGSVWINNCQIEGIEVARSRLGDISINKSSVIERIYIDHKSTAGFFLLQDNSRVGTFSLNNESELYSIDISIKSQVDYLNIVSNSKCGNINIKDSIINWSFWITVGCKIRDIRIDEGTSVNQFRILHGSSAQNIVISNQSKVDAFIVLNSVAERIFINDSPSCAIMVKEQSNVISIEINNSKMGACEFSESIINSIEVSNNSDLLRVTIKYLKTESKRLAINNSFVFMLFIQLDKSYQISANISEIWTLSLNEKIFPRDSILRVSDTCINSILIESVINLGLIVFSNIRPLSDSTLKRLREADDFYIDKTSEIRITNSDLGKANLIGCNLNEYEKFVFSNSKMLEVFIADTILPKKERIFTIPIKTSLYEILEQRRLALSQFKKIYENRGDIVMATEYHADEMETYRECLKTSPVLPSGKERWNSRGERINLWLNRYSSYYGNNWLRAVIVTLSADVVLFSWYCRCLKFKLGSDTAKFWDLASYSFEFLNPIRKADFIKDVPSTPQARAVDYLSRIIMAYLVYQTIAAFRKFGKKSV